jgi:hypothetical protein
LIGALVSRFIKEYVMDVNTTTNTSAAVSAYTAQLHQTAVRPRSQDTSSQPADSTQAADAKKKAAADQVSFTNEALRLSAQAKQNSQASNTVNQANSPQNANQYPPQNASQQQTYQTAGAQSVAQAISTYHNTFKI